MTNVTNSQLAQTPTYQIGDVIKLRATKLLPFGIAGTLSNGGWGIVREREITWDKRQLRHWRRNFALNREYDVLVLDKRPDHWEVSLRLAEFDPWTTAASRYIVSHLVDGTAVRFWNNAAIVELEPALFGVLHQADLPDWVAHPIEDLLWVGDPVRAEIQQIDPIGRTIKLTMKGLAKRRWEQHNFQAARTVVTAQSNQFQAQMESTPTVASATEWGINSILVIEDDAPQREALCRWLRNEKQHVYSAENAEQGLAQFYQYPINILICDLGLSAARDGISLLQEVIQHKQETRYILMTDWASAEQRHDEIVALEQAGVTFLIKPMLPQELATVLIDDHKRIPQSRNYSKRPNEKVLFTATPKRVRQSTQGNLQQVLHLLRQTTRATKVVLFALDTEARAITVAGQSGSPKLYEDALEKLIFSPVRDIAEDGITVQIEDSTDQSAYIQYLKPLLRFRSAVGVPVIVNQSNRYALLLFHTAPGFVGHVIQQEATAAAMQISALFEKHYALEQMAELQRTVLLGNLSRALIHETNNQLNPILFDLSDLQRQYAKVQRTIELGLSTTQDQIQETQQTVDRLTESIHKLVRTTRMFGRATVQDERDLVRVDQVADECISLVRDLAERAKIQVEIHPFPAPLITLAKFTQVQQVLLNLLLNAIQQLAISRKHQGGTIHLWFAVAAADDGIEAIRVLIEDDGPGIHCQLYHRIFELGMTTRQGEGGSGMGLFVSQRLIESAGGQLYIDESLPLWGTRMAAEFPIYVEKQMG